MTLKEKILDCMAKGEEKEHIIVTLSQTSYDVFRVETSHLFSIKELEEIKKNGLSDDHSDVQILKVIFNDPATIVFWSDGTKTVVKASGEEFDDEKGLAMAIAKKALGNKGDYYNVFKRFLITDEDLESIGEGPLSPIDDVGGKTE